MDFPGGYKLQYGSRRPENLTKVTVIFFYNDNIGVLQKQAHVLPYTCLG